MTGFEQALSQTGLPEWLIVVFISALPISELRGGIPMGMSVFGLQWYYILPIAIAGNLLPIPFVLLFCNGVARAAGRIAFLGRLLDWVFRRTRKNSGLVRKYQYIGLVLFVAVPLPLTGAYSGAIAAVLCGFPFWRSLLAIACGVAIAGIIVTVLTALGWAGAAIAGIALMLLAILGFWRSAQ